VWEEASRARGGTGSILRYTVAGRVEAVGGIFPLAPATTSAHLPDPRLCVTAFFSRAGMAASAAPTAAQSLLSRAIYAVPLFFIGGVLLKDYRDDQIVRGAARTASAHACYASTPLAPSGRPTPSPALSSSLSRAAAGVYRGEARAAAAGQVGPAAAVRGGARRAGVGARVHPLRHPPAGGRGGGATRGGSQCKEGREWRRRRVLRTAAADATDAVAPLSPVVSRGLEISGGAPGPSLLVNDHAGGVRAIRSCGPLKAAKAARRQLAP
jgi:hypothetical protein